VDELWQRYRSFWVPVLIGVGVFLVGLIVVHMLSDDPEGLRSSLKARADALSRKVAPEPKQIRDVQDNASAARERVLQWARKIDQAGLEDPQRASVARALQAAILRGVKPETLRAAVASGQGAPLDAFEGDAVAAGKALQRYEQVLQDRLNLLVAGDPNVGFSRLLNDVWSEIRLRANRADVELKADVLGFAGVKSVNRATLAERLLNLALVAEVVDLGIRSGLESVDEISFPTRANPETTDAFLREWPVTFNVIGDMDAVQPILDLLTDPERPTPLTQALLTQPPRGSPLDGLVRLDVTAVSTLVRPAATLDLDTE
jgi:hypothetical protein